MIQARFGQLDRRSSAFSYSSNGGCLSEDRQFSLPSLGKRLLTIARIPVSTVHTQRHRAQFTATAKFSTSLEPTPKSFLFQ